MSFLITFHINIVTRCNIDLQFDLNHIDASHLPDSIVLANKVGFDELDRS